MSNSNYSLPVVLLLAILSQPCLAADDDDETTNDAANEAPPCKYCPDYTGWSGWIEPGVGYQSDDDYHFGRYTGYDEKGGYINLDGRVDYRGEDGRFLEGEAEDLGIDSRRIHLQGGRQGRYEIGVEYDQIPNYRERSSFSPYREAGDGRLDLPTNWVAGPTTDSMPTLGGALARTPLKTKRDRSGANFLFYPSRRWEISGFARHEKKDGVKDMGATMGFSQTVILPVPFKYETNDFGVSLEYTGEKLQSQVSYTASLFKNDQQAIYWRNPYEDAASNTAWGGMAEAPDNQFHQLSAILGYQLLPSTRLGARLAVGRMTQDEDYLPYTINPAISTTALPTTSLDGQVDTTLVAVEVNSRPTSDLQLDASYTYSDRDNKTDTYVYDYVVTDSGPGGERMNRPYSYKQHLLRLKAGYQLPKNTNLSVGYDDDQMDRTYVQVEETHDKTLWTNLKLHPWDRFELTLKYAYSNRDASDYQSLASQDPLLDNPNSNFYDNPLMRAFNMADRTRDKAGFVLAYTPIDRLSLGLDLDYYKDDYDDMYLGLQQAKGLVTTASVSYSFSETLSGSAYYTYDKLSSDQKGSERLLVTQPGDPWIASDENLTHTVGVGINWMAIPEKLELGADMAYAEFTGKMEFVDSPDLPELSSNLTSIKVHGTYKLSDKLSLRGELLYEDYKEDDWSKTGVVNELPTLLSLGTAPQDNSTTLGLISVRYEF